MMVASNVPRSMTDQEPTWSTPREKRAAIAENSTSKEASGLSVSRDWAAGSHGLVRRA